jgi:hypothetical protein
MKKSLVDPEKIILPPLHIMLGLIKYFFFKLLEFYIFHTSYMHCDIAI